MSFPEEIRERLEELEEPVLLATGYDDALVGSAQVWLDGRCVTRAVYSMSRLITILTADGELDEMDAIEHINYNMAGAYVGDYTPIFLEDY